MIAQTSGFVSKLFAGPQIWAVGQPQRPRDEKSAAFSTALCSAY